MAMVKQETVQGFQGLPALRQIGLMIGLAASVALGVAVVLWSQEPNYTVLYAGLGNKDAGQVVDALKKTGIAFEIDQQSGAVMVASNRVRDARMELAKEGLPEGGSMGFEMLQKDQGFGTSQFIETARYQHALEGELSRTISTLRNVESARVHLAIPKRSVFLRDRASPTASVMVNLYSGRRLNEEQVSAIVHLVSSSVPNLETAKVTIVDQRGNLLSNGSGSSGMAASSSQFSYNRKLEMTYTDRIRKLLEPIVGPGRIRATVNADLDFTVTERTQENYNPDLPALRSEQVSEETSNEKSEGASGIPGALSNQPAGQPSLVDPSTSTGDTETTSMSGNKSTRSVRNYELDKTISHTKLASGNIRRLSVAVVIDNKQELDENEELVSKPWSADELERFTTLIKESVGFNARRGDTVNVINASFVVPPEPEPVPELSLMEQPWIWDVAKQAVGALGLLIVVFGILKPVMRSLAEKGEQSAQQQAALAAAGGGEVNAGGQDQLSLSGGTPQLAGPQANSYENTLETAKTVVNDDPKRVAQVVKNWVGEDG
ncbi:Flagellar M-ring protein FliF [hydrothermal vent metagenome]|uniref:Flagellar M-ring protein FliF n=1 Tax=hydrothermal vent metagenome TaxID=652676 RepID=A0A3B0YVV3_9ZZZZ